MKITWDIAKLKDVYGTEKKSQSKPFVIPGQDAAKTDSKKVSWGIDAIKDVYVPETKKK